MDFNPAMSFTQADDASGCESPDHLIDIYKLFDDLEAEHKDLKEKAGLINRLQEVQIQLEDEIIRHQAELSDSRAESELRLFQLHNAHEELEKMFFKYHETKKNLSKVKKKFTNELQAARQESERYRMQLRKTQEELERHYVESCRQAEKLHWLRGQRELLIRMVRQQGRKLRALIVVDGRVAGAALRRKSQPWWRRIIKH